MKKLTLLLALLATFIGTQGQTPAAQQPVVGGLTSNATDARQQAFEIVWRTVKEKHFDPTFGGLDWDKVKEQYAPRVAAVKSDMELYQLLQQMLGELHQSHFNIIPPGTSVADETREPRDGNIGIDLRVINNQAVITRVEPGSKAAAASDPKDRRLQH